MRLVSAFSAFILSAAFALMATLSPLHADALPWALLKPQNDTRDAEMQAWDEADSQNFVTIANQSEAFASRRFLWQQVAVKDVLSLSTPFAEIRFDPVKPATFTPAEKNALTEWFQRGGFLLLFEDAYPYAQEDFRRHASLPIYDFLTRELPGSNPGFTVERISDRHPLFSIYHQTTTVPSIAREMRENPNYRGRTLVSFHGRPVAFFMGRYNIEKDGRWLPMPRPLSQNHGSELKSYHLIINIYVYVMSTEPGQG